jgi:hypothetical protein
MKFITQRQWLDFIQAHSTTPILGCIQYNGYFSQWLPYNTFKQNITLRTPADHECILDFDGKIRTHNLKKMGDCMDLLSKTTYPHYMTDHNGRGGHIHIFNINKKEAEAIFKVVGTNVAEVLQGKHMVRDIGGIYKDGKHYCSCFKDLGSIRPITNPNDVEYPENINITNKYHINNYIKQERIFKDSISTRPVNTEVTIDNLPRRYKHLEGGVSDGERNDSFCKLVGVFKKCGLTRNVARQQILSFSRRCSPPISDKESDYKFKRLWK